MEFLPHTRAFVEHSPTGRPNPPLLAGLQMTAWKPPAHPGHSLGPFPPSSLTYNRKAAPPRVRAGAKAKQGAGGSQGGTRPGRNGVLRQQRRACSPVVGAAGRVLTVRRGLLTSSPRITWMYLCLKLKKKQDLLPAVGGRRLFWNQWQYQSSYLSYRGGTGTSCANISNGLCDNERNQSNLSSYSGCMKDSEPDAIREN